MSALGIAFVLVFIPLFFSSSLLSLWLWSSPLGIVIDNCLVFTPPDEMRTSVGVELLNSYFDDEVSASDGNEVVWMVGTKHVGR